MTHDEHIREQARIARGLATERKEPVHAEPFDAIELKLALVWSE